MMRERSPELTATTAPKQRGAPFTKGQSGNPSGRPRGARHKATLAAEALLDGEAEGLTRKAIQRALEGDGVALRLCLERILPARKDRPVAFELPALKSPADIVVGAAALVQAVANAELSPAEAADISKLLDNVGRAIELTDIEARLSRLEESQI
jgi:Family of unknown function (DUF5681)